MLTGILRQGGIRGRPGYEVMAKYHEETYAVRSLAPLGLTFEAVATNTCFVRGEKRWTYTQASLVRQQLAFLYTMFYDGNAATMIPTLSI